MTDNERKLLELYPLDGTYRRSRIVRSGTEKWHTKARQSCHRKGWLTKHPSGTNAWRITRAGILVLEEKA